MPSNENKERLLSAFEELGFDVEGVQHIRAMDFKDVVVFHIGDEPERIYFLSKVQVIDGVKP